MRVGKWEAGQDFYEILGIKPDATTTEVRRAHRRLALELHPDKLEENEAAMKRVNFAASVLLDPASRARYDALRSPHGAWPTPPRRPVVQQQGQAPRSTSRARATADRWAASIGSRAVSGGGGLPVKLVLFALVATLGVGCIARNTGGPVPVASADYRIPSPPSIETLWATR